MKKTKNNPRPSSEWFNKSEVAAFFGVTLSHVDKKYRPALSSDDIKKVQAGGHIRIWLRGKAVADVHVRHEIKRHERKLEVMNGTNHRAGDIDGPAEGVVDNWKDELNRTNELIKNIELERLHGVLLPRDIVHECLSRMAAILRTAGEQLQKTYGEDAREILDEALDEFDRERGGFGGKSGAKAEDDPPSKKRKRGGPPKSKGNGRSGDRE